MSPRGAVACSYEQATAPKPVILGKTLPNITHAHLKAGRHCVAMTKTRRAESVIVNLEQT
ncbi:MAG: hypothetical protein ACNYPD_06275 [Candidatus Halichondribacter symbioticus]